MARLSVRKLHAIEGALAAMCAGMEGDGDWPEGVTMEDMEAAHDWACQRLRKYPSRQSAGSMEIE